MSDLLDEIEARRERITSHRTHLIKAVDDARMRCEAVIMDAVATVERCRAAQRHRAARRRVTRNPPDPGGNGSR